MKRRTLLAPLVAVLLLAEAVSCSKSSPAGPAAPVQPAGPGPLAYLGGNNWNTLFYFGTYVSSLGGCTTPCGFCHATPWEMGYNPETGDPDNNKARAEITVTPSATLLVSVDLAGIGNYYVNDIVSTGQFSVAADTELPQSVVDEACDAGGIPHWGGPILVTRGDYPVTIDADWSRLELEGTFDQATGWSWTCYLR